MPEAKQRKSEIEYKQQLGSFIIPTCNTLNELLKEYVSLYGKTKWAINGYSSYYFQMRMRQDAKRIFRAG